jgi:hypothetical protein
LRLVEVRPTTARGLWALCDQRNWSFLPQLLENMRDALDAIKRGDA